ncbi:MAG TPA: glucosidase [Casimicrobiaceae bacterium]|nr:glucosidase [Casimicrobiaceae bacterium]
MPSKQDRDPPLHHHAGGDAPTAEEQRLAAARHRAAPWRRWGPYLSERQWGTVREDYSEYGSAWDYLPHDHARSRAYRWGEDGIAGICDDRQQLCFALALWNGQDPIVKERMFGLTGPEGNHGEDVKECYFYLDNVPSHAYMKYLYKYPQRAFPYNDLVQENRRRTRRDPEYELLDTGIFDDDRYFDVFVEYAKVAPDDILIRITAINRGPAAAPLHLLPTLWFKNVWSWYPQDESLVKPGIALARSDATMTVLRTVHRSLASYSLYCDAPDRTLFTENDTNTERLFGRPNAQPYVKDAFDNYLVHGRHDAVNPAQTGTKVAAHYVRQVPAGEAAVVHMRLCPDQTLTTPFSHLDATFHLRQREADAFYHRVTPFPLSDDMRNVQRQAFAGMLWNKQYYRYMVKRWLDGDQGVPNPPEQRKSGRNHDWGHFAAGDILSMPDKWEYPWFAAWDMAFHVVPLAMIDPDFAKDQLLLLMREWYMHPNGQIPAYEWAFGDVNPPVHAWAAIRIYQIEQKMYGRRDRKFLERVFQKLLLNFTWWVNRKDASGNNIFEGGFLGLDNISAFDRTSGLPTGGELEQADGTSWMAMYCLNLLGIALELAKEDDIYEDIATKFFEHFVYIASAVNSMGGRQNGLWDDNDGFYYDALKFPDGRCFRIGVQSIAGLIPIFAIGIGDAEGVSAFRDFGERLRWFTTYRPDLLAGTADMTHRGVENRVRLALVDSAKLRRILDKVLDEHGLLSGNGVRSVSRHHAANPFELDINGERFTLDYAPAESTSGLFGGNSNWRGPVWFPLNFLLIESLQKHHYYLGDDFKVELPSGSGVEATLWEVTTDLSHRLISLFLQDEAGRRPVNGNRTKFQTDPHWCDLIMFHEYFNGDTGEGLGAGHQTGWTGVVAKLIHQYAEYALQGKPPGLTREDGLGSGKSSL